MNVTTFEGVVENGQIRLSTNFRLPDKTKVYVVVPDLEVKRWCASTSTGASISKQGLVFA